jgi:hypothetical protein
MIKVATSTSFVTPQEPCFMGGYGMRTQKSEGVLDELKCTAVLLEIEGSRVVLCDVEILMITSEIVAAVKNRLQEEYGIQPEMVTIATTHTHAGPEIRSERLPMFNEDSDDGFWRRYQDFLKETIFATIAGCFEAELKEADAWYRTVKIEGLYGNRNGIGKPEDKDVTLIVFKNRQEVLAAIVNISCHPTVLGAQNLQISSDLLGYISRGVKERLGVYPLMMQGASGDMSNRNYRQGHDAQELTRTGEGILAQLFASEDLETLSLNKPVIEGYHWEISYPQDKEALRKLQAQIREQMAAENDYDKHKILLSSDYGIDLKLKKDEVTATFDAAVIRLGDIEICKQPGELFSRFGMQIKAASKAKLPLIWGYCDDYGGYLADEGEYGKTYESIMSPMPKGASEEITADLARLMVGETEKK